MTYPLEILKQMADGLARQFGSGCEIVIHDLQAEDIENSIVYIVNGHVSARKLGDGPSKVVVKARELMTQDPNKLEDKLAYLTRTSDGSLLKSSTIYIRDEANIPRYLFAINYDITSLSSKIVSLFAETDVKAQEKLPEPITNNVNDLLDHLIDQSVALVGKQPSEMNREEKITAIRFLNDAGAFLITRSGDKVSQYFGISKFTLYSYIDIKNNKGGNHNS